MDKPIVVEGNLAELQSLVGQLEILIDKINNFEIIFFVKPE